MAGPVPIKPPAGRSGPAIPTVLADDEALALDELAFLLREFPDIEIVGTARNGIEAVQCIEECEPDLVFLDVQMPGLDGLGVIHKLKADKAPMPAFVLCTAYEQYALEAFRLEALDYLLKPVDRDRLAQTVERVKRSLLEPEQGPAPTTANAGTASGPGPVARAKLLVKSSGRNLIVDASDLIYATIEDGLITVVTTAVEGQTNYKTIEELQSSLDPATFWRAHRGYVVNINHIREVIPWFKSSYQLRMNDKKGTEIPVSRVQTKRLRELFKL
ncbi:LytR/AlgR family response regulator transcription factor [Paludibaculum fermentans]|uniref:LytR/AlgR family response regulator transcription factor n=1 Tax=Paludibaculum fermentans TaxID=1473598 RepID=UPI003EB7DDCD